MNQGVCLSASGWGKGEDKLDAIAITLHDHYTHLSH